METQLKKVLITLSDDPLASETLWAEPIDQTRYRLRNIPFYAMGYAESDIVACQTIREAQVVTNIVKHSGNGTLRLIFSDSAHFEDKQILSELESVGCTYERASEGLVAVTVPPNLAVPFSQLSNYLNSIEDRILIGWEVAKQFTRVTEDG